MWTSERAAGQRRHSPLFLKKLKIYYSEKKYRENWGRKRKRVVGRATIWPSKATRRSRAIRWAAEEGAGLNAVTAGTIGRQHRHRGPEGPAHGRPRLGHRLKQRPVATPATSRVPHLVDRVTPLRRFPVFASSLDRCSTHVYCEEPTSISVLIWPGQTVRVCVSVWVSLVFESQEDSKAKKMALYMLMIAVLSAIAMVVVASEPTTETPVQTTTTSPETSSSDGAALLTVESQRLHELSQQVSQSNRALQDLLAAKLRDVNYATLISELRAEIDSLRCVVSTRDLIPRS